MGTQRLACDQLHRPPKLVFQQKRDSHKVVGRFFVQRELDEEIYVALRIGRIAPKRAKQADAPDAELTQIVPVVAQTSNCEFTCPPVAWTLYRLPRRVRES